MALYGGIEAGGTKFVCAIGNSPENIQAEARIPTTQPDETLSAAIDFFRHFLIKKNQRLDGIGIGSFGPLDLNPSSLHFGKITATPKPGWAFTDLVRNIQEQTGVPTVLDTDVNAAAFGEMVWGAAQGLKCFVYLTIGTGIGGGLIVSGEPHHGLVHPEMGHLRIPRDPLQDPYQGVCPFHGDCLEGLCSGPALKDRYGQSAETFPKDHPAWELVAHYIGLALNDIICITSPQRIILGGGVMQQHTLLPTIRLKVLQNLNRYVHSPAILDQIDQYIVAPGLGGRAGVLGAIALAEKTFPRIH